MHLPWLCYGNISGFYQGHHTVTLIILGLTGDHCPSILTVRMDVVGYFLPWMGMPHNNHRFVRFQND